MRARRNLHARITDAARRQGGLGRLLAQESLCQLFGEQSLANARRTDKQKRAGQPSSRQGAAELLRHRVVSFDALPGHVEIKREGWWIVMRCHAASGHHNGACFMT